MDKQHKWLIKRYHTLCTQMGMEAHEKAAILQAYNADSSLDLSVQDLQDICSKLEYMLQPDLEKMDLWRKRVMAAIGGWMRVINKDSSSAMIKGIACRASGYEKFNEIPRERLINLYHAFTKKQKDFQAVHEITSEEIEILAYCN
ncbi:MAG: hypothetical protein ABFD76_16560 [Smithella sp.]